MKSNAIQHGVVLVLALMAGFCIIAAAQETTATITGTVKDASGAVVPGVNIAVKNIATGVSRSVASDAGGRYTVPELAPGSYSIEASMTGFETYVRSGIELTVGRHATVDMVLQVGTVGEKVEVTGEAPIVETTSAGLAGLVGDKQIRDLPLNGRNFVQLTLLETGVVQSRSAGTSSIVGGGLKMNVNGARMDYNNFMMDGTSMNSVNQQAIGGASGEAMGVETIQEYQVLTSNYSAEFGRSAGGVINVVTKSGTNELHGSLFEFLRNSHLDARNFFDVGSIPPFKRNQFGATLGGPIKKDKTFIFGGYEGLRERLSKTLIANVPTVAARQGQFVPINPVAIPYLAVWPLPTSGGKVNNDGTAEYNHAAGQPTGQNFGQARVDQNFSEKDTAFLRYTIDDSQQSVPQPIPNYLPLITVRAQFATIGETHIFSPTLLNVFRFGFNRSENAYLQPGINPIVNDSSLWWTPNPLTPGLGNFGISNVGEPGGQTNFPKTRLDNVFQVVDTVNLNSSRHSIKFGGEFQRIQTNENDTAQGQGVFSFPNLTAFLSAKPSGWVGVLNDQTFIRGWRQNLVGMFIQDDIRLRPHFTLNLGVRWEFTSSPNEVNGRASHYQDFLTKDILVVGNPLMKLPKDNFAPRVGFAWDVFGNGKTSLRGGFGLYDQMIFRNYYLTARSLPPFASVLSAGAANACFPHPLQCLGSQPPLAPQIVDYNNKVPYVMHWNMSIEREIMPSTVLNVGYVGSRGLHLGRYTNPNVAIPQILPDGQYFYAPNLPVRDPNFTSTVDKGLRAASFYNALQVQLTRRLTKGLQLQGSYTWSHSLDNASGQLAGDYTNGSAYAQNPWDMNRTEWASSAFDLRHVLVANYTYVLPLGGTRAGFAGKLLQGWQTNGILNVTSGVPIDVENSSTLNRDRSGAGGAGVAGGASRPNLAPGRSNNPVLGGPDKYFDVTAFALQAPGFYGNLGRDTLIGPGLVSFDFGLVKNTPMGENKSLQFRAEAFNLFNRANFDLPNHTAFLSATGVPNSAAGRITATVTSSRQLQFGLKLIF